ncbi:MAG: hypothetical protein F7B59_02295 [Desulfurococcales archaeon]|nr:hypothetical protein [Desulfurococcales archaeon]
MGKIVVLGDKHTLLPFRLAGAEVREASSWDEAKSVISSDLAGEKDVSIVLLAAHLIPEEKRGEFRSLASKVDFTLVSLPTKWAPPKPVDMKKLLLEALGFG